MKKKNPLQLQMFRSLLKQQEHLQVKAEETRLACFQSCCLHCQICSSAPGAPTGPALPGTVHHSRHFGLSFHGSQLIFITQNSAVGITCYFNRFKWSN